MFIYNDQFQVDDKVKIITELGNVFIGTIVEIIYSDDKASGLWWHEKSTNTEEYFSFDELESVEIIG